MSASVVQNLGNHAVIGGPGRPKGSPTNHVRVGFSHKDFVAALTRNDMSVVDEMCLLYRDDGTPARTKFEILKELLSYLYPKRKQVDVRGDIEHRNLNVSWNIDGPPPTVPSIDAEPSDPA